MLDSLEILKADLNDQRTSRRKLSSIGYRKLGCEPIKGMAKIAMDEAVEIAACATAILVGGKLPARIRRR